MICPVCHGQKTDGPPCPECGGCGFAHCCEGDRAVAKEITDLDIEYRHHTEKGLLVKSEFGKEVWLALSLVECDLRNVHRGQIIEIAVPTSYAVEKELV